MDVHTFQAVPGDRILEIDKAAIRTFKEAAIGEPPFLIDDLLDHLEIDRLGI